MEVDLISFVLGYIICMICDLVFSITNYFVQKAMFYSHNVKKKLKKGDCNDD